MKTVGVYLKKKREAKNISLREVARLTKISEFYLDYIEKDDYEKLPQGPYIKGYISSYSSLIGGNVDEALNLYNSLSKKRAQTGDIQSEISDDQEFDGVESSAKATSASLMAVAPSPQTHIISFFKRAASVVAANRWLTRWRTWLVGCMALLCTSILVLAGFGFYHLFIYQAQPPPDAESQMPPDNDPSSPLNPPAEQQHQSSVSSNPDATVSQVTSSARRSDGIVESADQSSPSNPPAEQQHQSSVSSNPDATVSQVTSTARRSDGIVESADLPVSSPPTILSLSPNKAATSQSEDDGQPTSPSAQRETATHRLAESTIAATYVNVSKATICSQVNDRMPVGIDTIFSSSVQRVYVWNQIETRQIPSEIRHIYYFKGRKINDVSLDVRSPFWRTWSYKSISSDRYRGKWRVDIATAGGKVLRSLHFEIR